MSRLAAWKKKYDTTFYKSLYFIEMLDYPPYAYALYQAARQAQSLNIKKISAIEFGVAGGNGLVYLEKHAQKITELLGVDFEIYGFDTGEGLPELQGYKDLQHQWHHGSFPMDMDALRARLQQAKLVIGDVKDTVKTFYKDHMPAPVGAILFDLDLYSSTKAALEIFNTEYENLLPRVRCYFDDVMGNETSLPNEYVGERLAINEYNAEFPSKKVTPVLHLRGKPIQRKWYGRSFVHHAFDHPRYSDFISNPNQISYLRAA